MAKVTETDARKTALASFSANTAKIVEAELEVERGCLIYSFDITVLGKDGVEEVWIDAGSGQLLAREHETAQHEATEATLENVEPSNR